MRLVLVLLAAVLLGPPAALRAADAPNFVIILADDLGYGDMQANNPDRGKIPTPNMNRLAAEGMRFTDGHSSSGCCSPSRYTLLTGRYHWRTTLQSGIVGVWRGPLIPADRLTIASLAKAHGYATACIGKWHLGRDWPITSGQQPLFAGFGGKSGGGGPVATAITDAHREAWRAVFSQRIPGGPTERGFDEYFGTDVPNWPPYCFIDGDRTVGIPSELLPAAKLVKNQASLQGPALPGWQLEGVLPALASRAETFIRTQAEAGRPFLLYLPLTSPHTPLAVNAEWKGEGGLGSDYADLVVETDAVLGRVLAALEAAGVEGDTFVLFTSDNGCAPYIGVKALEEQGHFPSGPLRDYKASVYEGGHRVPFVVKWPGVVKAGSVCGQLVQQADIIATLAEILGATLPETAGEDSFSLVPLLKDADRPGRRILYVPLARDHAAVLEVILVADLVSVALGADVAHAEQHQLAVGVFGHREHGVGRLARVVPEKPAAEGHHPDGVGLVVIDRPAGHVQLVGALVVEIAVAGLPEPVPVVMDVVRVVALDDGRRCRRCFAGGCRAGRPPHTSAGPRRPPGPSTTSWLSGFSTETCLPAWAARIVISECQ